MKEEVLTELSPEKEEEVLVFLREFTQFSNTNVVQTSASQNGFYCNKSHSSTNVRKLRRQLQKLEIEWDSLAFDEWLPFQVVFREETCKIGKEYIEGIEGNNCRIRHRARRAFRKTCNFSKKFRNHIIAFKRVFYYINFGFV